MSEDSSLGSALFSVTVLNIFLKVLKYKETLRQGISERLMQQEVIRHAAKQLKNLKWEFMTKLFLLSKSAIAFFYIPAFTIIFISLHFTCLLSFSDVISKYQAYYIKLCLLAAFGSVRFSTMATSCRQGQWVL